jgi:hypothetical protein
LGNITDSDIFCGTQAALGRLLKMAPVYAKKLAQGELKTLYTTHGSHRKIQ